MNKILEASFMRKYTIDKFTCKDIKKKRERGKAKNIFNDLKTNAMGYNKMHTTQITINLTHKNKIIKPQISEEILDIFKNAKITLLKKKKACKARTIQNLLYLCGRVVAKKP